MPGPVATQVTCRLMVVSLLMMWGSMAASEQQTDQPGEISAEAPESEVEPDNDTWLDSSYEGLDDTAEGFAHWVDSFFGHVREDQDAPDSLVRIRPGYQWDEQDGSDWKLRLSGKLHLPKTSDRLSVVFLGDEGNPQEDFYDPALASGGGDSAGIQYEVRRKSRSSAYLFAGIKSGPKAKLGARYRHYQPFLEKNLMRFSEEVFWIGGDGFGSLTRLDFDHLLTEKTLIRWANKAEIREDSNGWEWNTRLAWIRKLSEREAVRVFGFVRGDSDPRILRARGFGVGFRRRFLRDWLFLEFEPRYSWRKRLDEPDREGVFQFEVRVEAVIGDL